MLHNFVAQTCIAVITGIARDFDLTLSKNLLFLFGSQLSWHLNCKIEILLRYFHCSSTAIGLPFPPPPPTLLASVLLFHHTTLRATLIYMHVSCSNWRSQLVYWCQVFLSFACCLVFSFAFAAYGNGLQVPLAQCTNRKCSITTTTSNTNPYLIIIVGFLVFFVPYFCEFFL